MLSLADFRAPIFSLSVARDDVGLEDEFELFMRLLVLLSQVGKVVHDGQVPYTCEAAESMDA